MDIELTPDQERVADEILGGYARGSRHLLTGYAGTGKTTLMQDVARRFQEQGRKVVLTAPTHKAVAVLSAKVKEAGIEAPCMTVHSLLSLRPKAVGAVVKLVRNPHAKDVSAHVVIIDECSMVCSDLMAHINRHLRGSYVLFVGDPAQLPPVGEKESQTFGIVHRSHLDTIVRQAEGNPILAATAVIRASQAAGVMDWSWASAATAPPLGVYCPNGAADQWMQKAFTSERFNKNRDAFRYLCWTNARVADVNRKVRRWIYGETTTPFSIGESVLFRAPVIRDEIQYFATNEEAVVRDIQRGVFQYTFPKDVGEDAFSVEIPSWVLTFDGGKGKKDQEVHIPQNHWDYQAVDDRLKIEQRWKQRHEFSTHMGKVQSIYALTTHSSQGSTFDVAFVDVPDIRRRVGQNLLEAQQLYYVAATRPRESLILVGV